MGSGQFCTNPGLVMAVDGAGLDAFLTAARDALAQSPATPMLTPGIAANYADGVVDAERRGGPDRPRPSERQPDGLPGGTVRHRRRRAS